MSKTGASGGTSPTEVELTIKEPRSFSANDDGDDDDLRSLDHETELADPFADGWAAYFHRSLKEVLLGSYLNILMLLTPFALLSNSLGWSDGVTFALNLLAIAPFAERLGYVTEQVALHTNDTLGGLLNATFGNATELIICIFALRDGLLRVVQLSLLGSILSNMLLVLGTAFFVGGMRHKVQNYSKAAAVTNSGLLNLAVMALLLPAVLNGAHEFVEKGDEKSNIDAELQFSRFVSVILLITYCVYLYFQLVTHTHLFEGEDTGEDEENVLGFWGAISWLGILTIFISLLSEGLVEAIKGAAEDWGISTIFIGAIIIPIVGNAAEHAAAVIFAYRNKMDITLGVAIVSSTQIAIFVIPFCVVMSWIMGPQKDGDGTLDLYFHMYETATLLITVITVSFITQSGESNWLTGFMLLVAYAIIAAGFWFHKDENLNGL